jgi:AraC-like DNA-binding protein
MRTLDDFELVWMLRGRARLTGDADVDLTPGHLLLIGPGLAHGFEWDRRRSSRHGYVHFDAELLGVDRPSPPEHRAMTSNDPLAGLCAYLLWLGQLDDWELRAHEALRYLLTVFLARPLPDAGASRLAPPLAAAVDSLRASWAKMPLPRIRVDALAAAAAISRGYLTRLFQKNFAMSPAPALEHLRCSRAETLLLRTDLGVETIAHQCGYADPSHFSHRFSAIHGVPPTAFRLGGGAAPSVLDHVGIRRLAHLVWD